MIFLELVALVLMIACLGQVAVFAWRWEKQLILPSLLYLTVSAMLFFAAFGGDSHLVTDVETMVTRGLGIAVIAGLVAGYFYLIRKARARAADRDGS
ncbi:MAG: hypothetical protein AAFS07_17205 [Pseudomonadota bacterium]